MDYTETNSWTFEKPAKPGFYWCLRDRDIRVVRVWSYVDSQDTSLFTNEDGGASLDDPELYGKGTLWSKEITPPDPPRKIEPKVDSTEGVNYGT